MLNVTNLSKPMSGYRVVSAAIFFSLSFVYEPPSAQALRTDIAQTSRVSTKHLSRPARRVIRQLTGSIDPLHDVEVVISAAMGTQIAHDDKLALTDRKKARRILTQVRDPKVIDEVIGYFMIRDARRGLGDHLFAPAGYLNDKKRTPRNPIPSALERTIWGIVSPHCCVANTISAKK